MKELTVKGRFIHLKAQGWSFDKVARELKESKPILVVWAVTGQESTGSL